MSSFPAQITENIDQGSSVQEYTPSQTAGEVAAKSGELMYFDTADQKIKRCGADPALIAGICEESSEANRVLTPNGKVPLRLLTSTAGVRLCSAVTLTEAHVGVAYGIVRDANGHWAIDTTDTGATRVVAYRIDTVAQAAYCRFLAANLQFDAVAS